MQCNNPCQRGPGNSPQCESLPSQIQNFTDQFFGTVVKTEVNGEVVWSLPCSLDVGLPNNPRAQGEGLACYFLRLFMDGIGGLTGPQGDPGTPGVDGANTYSVTTQPFTQPSIENPLTQIVIVPNPAIIAGIGVYIQGSGAYEVSSVQPGGVVFVTLVSPASGAASVIPAGAIVVPIGIPTAGIGPQGPAGTPGPAGPQGPQGLPGAVITSLDNGTWTGFTNTGAILPGAAGYVLTGSTAPVIFGTQTPGFSPKGAGTYLVNVTLPIWTTTTGGGNIYAWISSSVSGAYAVTQQIVSLPTQGIATISMTAVITTSGTAGEHIGLLAYTATPGGIYIINSSGAQFSWVRIA